jgi:hypothetical protein
MNRMIFRTAALSEVVRVRLDLSSLDHGDDKYLPGIGDLVRGRPSRAWRGSSAPAPVVVAVADNLVTASEQDAVLRRGPGGRLDPKGGDPDE